MKGIVVGGGAGGSQEPTGSSSIPVYFNSQGEAEKITSLDSSLIVASIGSAGASDTPVYVNSTGKATPVTSINSNIVANSKFNDVHYVTLSSGSWTSSKPYYQTKTTDDSGNRLPYTSSSVPVVSIRVSDLSDSGSRTILENYGYLTAVETADGQITAYCSSDKPTCNLTLIMKGY